MFVHKCERVVFLACTRECLCVFCALFKISFLIFFEVVVTFCRHALFSRVFVVFSFLTFFFVYYQSQGFAILPLLLYSGCMCAILHRTLWNYITSQLLVFTVLLSGRRLCARNKYYGNLRLRFQPFKLYLGFLSECTYANQQVSSILMRYCCNLCFLQIDSFELFFFNELLSASEWSTNYGCEGGGSREKGRELLNINTRLM